VPVSSPLNHIVLIAHRTSACGNPEIPAERSQEAANMDGYRGLIFTRLNVLNEKLPQTETVGTGGYGVDRDPR